MLRLVTTVLILNWATFAAAGHFGGGSLEGRGFGFGGHHGFFGEFGGLGLGFGLGANGTERTQERFEDRFDDLMSDYEDGVAEITDFYTSEEYTDIVDDTELLVDRYDFFVSGVERNVERLTDFISIANDDLTYYNDLLIEYQADEDLSETRLERIEDWVERITDRISLRIDRLTDVQTTLQENLPDYLTFQSDVSTFLTDIVAAGATTDTASVFASVANPNAMLVSVYDELAEPGCDTVMNSASMAAPEPTSILSLLTVVAMMAMVRRRRRR